MRRDYGFGSVRAEFDQEPDNRLTLALIYAGHCPNALRKWEPALRVTRVPG